MILDTNPFGKIRGKLSCTPAEALEQFNFEMDPDAQGVIFRQYHYLEGGKKKTGTFISNYFPPSNPRTPTQQAHRTKMQNAVAHWHTLGYVERVWWNNEARRRKKKYMGYHLHNSEYIKGHV